MSNSKKFDLETPAPVVDDKKDEETLAAIDEGMRDAECQSNPACRRSPSDAGGGSPGDRLVKSGHYIKHEDVKAWLLSWGTDRELPPPKCACGSFEC